MVCAWEIECPRKIQTKINGAQTMMTNEAVKHETMMTKRNVGKKIIRKCLLLFCNITPRSRLEATPTIQIKMGKTEKKSPPQSKISTGSATLSPDPAIRMISTSSGPSCCGR